jgi:hypothetical protein
MNTTKIAENVSNRYMAGKEKFRVLGEYSYKDINGPARPSIEEAFQAFQDKLLKIQAVKGRVVITQFFFAREVPYETASDATETFGYESFRNPILWDKCYQELIQNRLASIDQPPRGRDRA